MLRQINAACSSGSLITEIAILRTTTSGRLDDSLKSLLAEIQARQNEWHAANFPSLPWSSAGRAAAWFQQAEDPSCVLTTVHWASVAAHWTWIGSHEIKTAMTQLENGEEGEGGGYISMGKFVLYHVDGDLFGGGLRPPAAAAAAGNPGAVVGLLESPVVSVERILVEAESKDAFGALFEELREVLDNFAVKDGWRADGAPGGATKEEFVLVCGWPSVGRHAEFAQSAGFPRYNHIRQFVASGEDDVKHYKRFM
ncbi:hypothetical protein B0H63DRAFT_452209 [Podospora didyma]|uniref:ABM domain-containing protein n=1 Tax=Podospora didyma TaxID=330526 RepID=A0AAE0NBZ9_9PEZI|nr:hypothetical protein B0H63DRAFT_452209 [Podospora didyma]